MNQINLLPEEFLKERFRRRMDLTLVVLFAVVMISVILAERINSRNFELVTQAQTREDGQFAQVENSSKEFFSLVGKRNEYIAAVKKAMELEQKIPRSYVLGVITNACPDELSLEKIVFSVKEKVSDQRKGKTVMTVSTTAQPQQLSVQDEDIIDIYGVAGSDSDVTDFVSKLRSNPVFSDVNLIQTKEWTPLRKGRSGEGKNLFEPSREFTLTLKVSADVDVRELIRKDDESSKKKAQEAGGVK